MVGPLAATELRILQKGSTISYSISFHKDEMLATNFKEMGD